MVTHKELTHAQVCEKLERIAKGGAVDEEGAALVFGKSKRTIRRWIAWGILRVERITQRTVLVDRQQAMAFIQVPLPLDEVDQEELRRRITR